MSERVAPIRIQLSRKRGYRKPPRAVVVSRPSKWGNPFDWREALAEYGCTEREAKATVVSLYRDWLGDLVVRETDGEDAARSAVLNDLASLRGRNVACWCGPDDPCHGDVLLELANTEQQASGE